MSQEYKYRTQSPHPYKKKTKKNSTIRKSFLDISEMLSWKSLGCQVKVCLGQ